MSGRIYSPMFYNQVHFSVVVLASPMISVIMAAVKLGFFFLFSGVFGTAVKKNEVRKGGTISNMR